MVAHFSFGRKDVSKFIFEIQRKLCVDRIPLGKCAKTFEWIIKRIVNGLSISEKNFSSRLKNAEDVVNYENQVCDLPNFIL